MAALVCDYLNCVPAGNKRVVFTKPTMDCDSTDYEKWSALVYFLLCFPVVLVRIISRLLAAGRLIRGSRAQFPLLLFAGAAALRYRPRSTAAKLFARLRLLSANYVERRCAPSVSARRSVFAFSCSRAGNGGRAWPCCAVRPSWRAQLCCGAIPISAARSSCCCACSSCWRTSQRGRLCTPSTTRSRPSRCSRSLVCFACSGGTESVVELTLRA